MSSLLEKVVVLGAVAGGVGALGYYGEGMAANVESIEALPETVRNGLSSGIEYVSKNINTIGHTVSDMAHLEVDEANVRLRDAIVAGTAVMGLSAVASALLGGVASGESTNPGGIPAGPGGKGPSYS